MHIQSKSAFFLLSSVLSISFIHSPAVFAASFAVKEHSTRLQGTSYAGATTGQGTDNMFFNPASLGFISDTVMRSDVALIMPQTSVKNVRANRLGVFPHTGKTSDEDFFDNAVIPSLSFATPLTEKFHLGLTINSPFGIIGHYDKNWAGRYHNIDTELRTTNITPILSYKPMPTLSIAAGPQIQYAKVRIADGIDKPLINSALGGQTSYSGDGIGIVKGDNWALGFVAGLLLEVTPKTHIGLSYRSGITHNMKANAHYTNMNDIINDNSSVILNLNPLITGTPNSALGLKNGGRAYGTLNLPATVHFGLSHEVTDRLTLMADASLTQWSSFKELRIDYETVATGQPDSVTTFNGNDSMFYALGSSYHYNDKITFRTGIGYDETPVNDAYRTPHIPDGNRILLSAGLGYQITPRIAIDFGYSHIFIEKSHINLAGAGENASRGSLEADYHNSIDVIMLASEIKM